MATKKAVRTHVWDRLDAEGIARFPFPPHGRIPNFDGADAAADELGDVGWWSAADVIKCNPDAPQRHVRAAALSAGKTVVMAQPRLRSTRPFVLLEPATIDDPWEASTIGGAEAHGRPVTPAELPGVDAIVAGSVAVDRRGRRIGKGEGYSDLEFGVLLELGVIDRSVPVGTTVHDVQVLDGPLETDDHDVSLDTIATPTTRYDVTDRPPRPDGIDWSRLDADRLEAIPILEQLSDD